MAVGPPSEYRFRRRVSFHETDMAGVVHVDPGREHLAEGTMAVAAVRQEPDGRMVPVMLPEAVVQAFQPEHDTAS